MQFLILLWLWLIIYYVNGQQIKYLNELHENDECDYDDSGSLGICKKVLDCKTEFENFKKNQTILKICSYSHLQVVICCPKNQKSSNENIGNSEIAKNVNLVDYETCRDAFLMYRTNGTSISHYGNAFADKKIPQTMHDCMNINELNEIQIKENFWDIVQWRCEYENGNYSILRWAAVYGETVRKGDRPNMAAIGWTQGNREIVYICGGSVITERYIVTAAHCKFFEGKEPDLARIGDRYLFTPEDDDIAQQVNIEKFIEHPGYTSLIHYNDIALIKTVEKVIFNKFVVPSCIADLDEEPYGIDTAWTVAGYGKTEDGVPSNILLELKVELVPNDECNQRHSFDSRLPNGIIESQLCVKAIKKIIGEKVIYPDTCFGDSGSPLQYKTAHETFPDDFNEKLLSKFYLSSNVIGVVSFGTDCGLDTPSVYTKLSYFRDWMKSVIELN